MSELVWLQLRPGADLLASIQRYIEVNSLDGGTIVSGVGSLTVARLRTAVPDDATPQVVELAEALEIISLQGIVRRDQRTRSHLHIAVADHTGAVTGGHLAPGCIVRLGATVAMLPRGTVVTVE